MLFQMEGITVITRDEVTDRNAVTVGICHRCMYKEPVTSCDITRAHYNDLLRFMSSDGFADITEHQMLVRYRSGQEKTQLEINMHHLRETMQYRQATCRSDYIVSLRDS